MCSKDWQTDLGKSQWSRSVMSDSLWPHRLQPIRLLCPWDFPGKSTGVGWHLLLQVIFPTQGFNPGLLNCRQMLYVWATKEAPCTYLVTIFLVMGFAGGSADKESACNAGNLGLILELGRSPGERKDYTLQFSGLENSMDYIVHGVTKSWTRLSDFHVTFSLYYTNSILF